MALVRSCVRIVVWIELVVIVHASRVHLGVCSFGFGCRFLNATIQSHKQMPITQHPPRPTNERTAKHKNSGYWPTSRKIATKRVGDSTVILPMAACPPPWTESTLPPSYGPIRIAPSGPRQQPLTNASVAGRGLSPLGHKGPDDGADR
jgi:hypothetical protein